MKAEYDLSTLKSRPNAKRFKKQMTIRMGTAETSYYTALSTLLNEIGKKPTPQGRFSPLPPRIRKPCSQPFTHRLNHDHTCHRCKAGGNQGAAR